MYYIECFSFQLQKLAIETGEESIVITTNVTAGTYNHLGSYLGREYLQDGGMTVEVLCENFMTFCKSKFTKIRLLLNPNVYPFSPTKLFSLKHN